ncbi:hypothetical protein FACS1894170_04890 [Planctomycetales bacterium]|nr:hypothetical protein FACS1894170_04890 [Planctomycetales bacterium]
MKLYAFTTPDIPKNAGYLKIGETNGSVDKRIKEQGHTLNTQPIKVWEGAVLTDRSHIDKRIHQYLREQGFDNPKYSDTGEYTELVKCTVADLEKAFEIVKQQIYDEEKQREEVGNQFYLEIRNWFYWVAKTGDDPYSVAEPEYTLRLIVRLMFVFFLKEKGLVPKELFEEDWVKGNLKENEEYRYYNAVLRNLFFYSLNTPQNQRGELEHKKLAKNLTRIKDIFKQIPFLNGGLFNEHPGDDFAISNDHFFSELQTRHIKELDGDYKVEGIIRLLSKYQFKTELDLIDAAEYTKTIDPEFIGKVFESLLACIDADSKESRRKITGSFYTPREIVDYMVNESLNEYLKTHNELLRCKILDPACGSGAFPCGVMNEIMQRIDPNKELSQTERYRKKLDILRNVIYGVDIQPMAVQIAILRLFLSLIQEIVPDKKKDNFGIEPLPNLETKFVCANTLIGLKYEKQGRLESPVVKATVKQLQETRHRHFMSSHSQEKNQLREYDETLRETLSIAMEADGEFGHDTALRLAQWNPYDQTKSAEFFDPMWMFGIDNFDIVIGNPPYDVLSTKHPLINYFHKNFRCTAGGKVNLYKLFFERGLSLLLDGGILCFITPYNYLTSGDSKSLRKMLINDTTIREIIDYEESQRVFESATQAVATICTQKKKSGDYSFRYKKQGIIYTLQAQTIRKDGKLLIKGTNSITDKMKQCKKTFVSIADGWQGEINVSTRKEHFIDKPQKGYLPLIRGNQIGYYQTVLEPTEFCPVTISARKHHTKRRIVFQEVANSGLTRRIKGAILEDILCGHTTNYLLPKRGVPLEAILGLLNSKIVNYYFKFYNQTNHVPIGELKVIPVPNDFTASVNIIAALVERRLNGENVDAEIDALVYELYGLTVEEIAVVEGQSRNR